MAKVTAGKDQLGDFAPEFAHLNDDVLFGEVWAREKELPLKTRSIVTVTALMASGVLDSSLKFHIAKARENGVTKEEMRKSSPSCFLRWVAQSLGRLPLCQGGLCQVNIVVLNGSPRPHGNTAFLVDAFREGAQEAGHTVTVLPVASMKIAGCLGCEYCHGRGQGKCIQKDDHPRLSQP